MKSLESDQFNRALAKLEYELEIPAIPGELASWAARLSESAAGVHKLLEVHLAHAHPEQFSEIIQRDPSLSRRVEQLRHEDDAILESYNGLSVRINDFAEAALRADEAVLLGRRRKLVEDGLKLVLRIRKQEVAVENWYIEAFARDVGAPD